MGPIAVFMLGAGAALLGRNAVKRGVRGVVKQAVKTTVELERTVAATREDLEDMAASAREEQSSVIRPADTAS